MVGVGITPGAGMERHAAFELVDDVQLNHESDLTDLESEDGLFRHGLRVDARHDANSIAKAAESGQLSWAIRACEEPRKLPNSW